MPSHFHPAVSVRSLKVGCLTASGPGSPSGEVPEDAGNGAGRDERRDIVSTVLVLEMPPILHILIRFVIDPRDRKRAPLAGLYRIDL